MTASNCNDIKKIVIEYFNAMESQNKEKVLALFLPNSKIQTVTNHPELNKSYDGKEQIQSYLQDYLCTFKLKYIFKQIIAEKNQVVLYGIMSCCNIGTYNNRPPTQCPKVCDFSSLFEVDPKAMKIKKIVRYDDSGIYPVPGDKPLTGPNASCMMTEKEVVECKNKTKQLFITMEKADPEAFLDLFTSDCIMKYNTTIRTAVPVGKKMLENVFDLWMTSFRFNYEVIEQICENFTVFSKIKITAQNKGKMENSYGYIPETGKKETFYYSTTTKFEPTTGKIHLLQWDGDYTSFIHSFCPAAF